jgi:hypothetical protein
MCLRISSRNTTSAGVPKSQRSRRITQGSDAFRAWSPRTPHFTQQRTRRRRKPARAGEKVSAKARKPRQKGADTAVRTTTAEVDADPKDAALREFDGHVLRLAQIVNRAEPERFARTSVDVDKLLQLSRFLAEVAGQQPQRADGQSRCVIESNEPKKPIPPGLKPIQPGERHQSASGSGFLYWRNFSPIDEPCDLGVRLNSAWKAGLRGAVDRHETQVFVMSIPAMFTIPSAKPPIVAAAAPC